MAAIEDRRLIERFIEAQPHRAPDRARLRDVGIEVWALVLYYQHTSEESVDLVARDYCIPTEAVEAALAYYDQHKEVIDARITLSMAFAG